MEKGTIVEWLKKEGERVSRGEAIAVIEGEKTSYEIESDIDGVLERILRSVGEEVSVGEAIAEVTPMEAKARAAAPTPETRAERRAASPAARRLAEEHGIDISTIKGTGPGGAVTREDVLRVIETRPAAPAGEAPSGVAQTVKMTGLRKAIAERLSYSLHTSAPVTLTAEFDATKLLSTYGELKRRMGDEAPSITSLILKACASLLKENPEFNAEIDGDQIRIRSEVNISVAIDTPAGLYAPVIKNADKLSLEETERELRELRRKALEGRLTQDELRGHTFTVTNLGGEGVYYFTPILNPPAVCILGVGAIVKKPVVVEERVEPRSIGHLSLVFDHRAVDGAPAARFLAKIKKRLEDYSL